MHFIGISFLELMKHFNTANKWIAILRIKQSFEGGYICICNYGAKKIFLFLFFPFLPFFFLFSRISDSIFKGEAPRFPIRKFILVRNWQQGETYRKSQLICQLFPTFEKYPP